MIVTALLISGCVQQESTCNKPYIKVGAGCCLDENSNGICDKDETSPTTTQKTTTLSPAKITTSPNIEINVPWKGSNNDIRSTVSITNTGDRTVRFVMLCDADANHPGIYSIDGENKQGISDIAKNIPVSGLPETAVIRCSYNNHWVDTIAPSATLSIDVSATDINAPEVRGKTYHSKLVIVDYDTVTTIGEIPISVTYT